MRDKFEYGAFRDKMLYKPKRFFEEQFIGLVSVHKAAEDKRLMQYAEWMVGDVDYPQFSVEEGIANLIADVAEERGLDPDEMSQAINICLEQALRKEVRYGEA